MRTGLLSLFAAVAPAVLGAAILPRVDMIDVTNTIQADPVSYGRMTRDTAGTTVITNSLTGMGKVRRVGTKEKSTLVTFEIPSAAGGKLCGLRLEINEEDPYKQCVGSIDVYASTADPGNVNYFPMRGNLLGTIDVDCNGDVSPWAGTGVTVHDIPCGPIGGDMAFELVPTPGANPVQVQWDDSYSKVYLEYGE